MWLLNTRTYELKRFFSDVPRYAILSHTWAVDEPTFDDLATGTAHLKAGYQKIEQSCAIAAESDISHIWIDTICIDKRSSSELSEAINSMYRYYERSYICYAYLEDISSGEIAHNKIMASRWWTRGWTLQELIAPKEVVFYSTVWFPIASKGDLASSIFQATGIDESILKNSGYLHSVSVAKRMSWAAKRETTREEDIAYCLLGVFGVSMPLLYGEGPKSFSRLQEEIMKESSDQSLFAWSRTMESDDSDLHGMLAPHPRSFSNSGDIVPFQGIEHFGTATEHYTMTNKGLQISLPVLQRKEDRKFVAILACHREGNFMGALGISLRPIPGSSGKAFIRDISTGPEFTPLDLDLNGILSTQLGWIKIQSIYILNDGTSGGTRAKYAWLRTYPKSFMPDFEFNDLRMQHCRPWHHWNTKTDTTIPFQKLDPSLFSKQTPAVFFRVNASDKPSFGIILGVDETDNYTTHIDIWIPLKEKSYPSAAFLNKMRCLKKFELKRVANCMISPNMRVTATTSWKSIMNSEVLVIDIFVNKPREIWHWWFLFKETSKIQNWPTGPKIPVGLITSVFLWKAMIAERELVTVLACAWVVCFELMWVDVWLKHEVLGIAKVLSLFIVKPLVLFLLYYSILIEVSPFLLVLESSLGGWFFYEDLVFYKDLVKR